MVFRLYSRKNLRQLRTVKLKFLHNCRGFFEKYRYPIYFFLIAAALDCMTTSHFMLLSGVDSELNPHVRLISTFLGPIWGPVAGKLWQCFLGIFTVIYIRKYAKLIIWSATSLYALAAWYNMFITDFLDWMFIAL